MLNSTRFRVIVGSNDLTPDVEGLTFSNVDPGGFEISSFNVHRKHAPRVNLGDRVRVTFGTATVWEGRVGEPQYQGQKGIIRLQVAGEGFGAQNKDNAMAMIYVDRDLTKWVGPSVSRQIALAVAAQDIGQTQVGIDPNATKAGPALVQTVTGAWVAAVVQVCEAWYDAGPYCLINSFYLDLTSSNANGVNIAAGLGWHAELLTADDDKATNVLNETGDLINGSEQTGYQATRSKRWGAVWFFQNGAGTGSENAKYQAFWHNLTAYGNHGLTRVGSPDPQGFYPQDIAVDAFNRANALAAVQMQLGIIGFQSSYVCAHYVQYTPVAHEQIISDMAKLLGWHYGVWESLNIFDPRPRFDFRPPPTSWTAVCSAQDCDNELISEHLGDLYNKAIITYQDAAGTNYTQTINIDVGDLDINHIGRTTTLNLGISSAGAAAAFASYVLVLMNLQARGAGSITLPAFVKDASGASKPAFMLRAGIDRIRITDLPNRLGILSIGQGDTFHVARVETTVDQAGIPSTSIELDTGANLIESLQARLDIATKIGGG